MNLISSKVSRPPQSCRVSLPGTITLRINKAFLQRIPYDGAMRFQAAIFADGSPCPASLRERLRKGRFTIVLDGAAERVRREGWAPNLLAGDFDSISKPTLKYFEKRGTMILHTPDQEFTDLEKALAWCALRDAESIWIAQALGGRADHSLANLSLLKRFHRPGRELILFQSGEKISFVRNQVLQLKGKKGRLFAVLPFPKCKVRSKGLAFEMKGTELELGRRESVSNRAGKAQVQLFIKGEAILVEGIP